MLIQDKIEQIIISKINEFPISLKSSYPPMSLDDQYPLKWLSYPKTCGELSIERALRGGRFSSTGSISDEYPELFEPLSLLFFKAALMMEIDWTQAPSTLFYATGLERDLEVLGKHWRCLAVMAVGALCRREAENEELFELTKSILCVLLDSSSPRPDIDPWL